MPVPLPIGSVTRYCHELLEVVTVSFGSVVSRSPHFRDVGRFNHLPAGWLVFNGTPTSPPCHVLVCVGGIIGVSNGCEESLR